MWGAHAAIAAGALGIILAGQPARARDCRHLPAPSRLRATANDNRVASGAMVDSVLTVHLVARAASWYPDGPDGCAVNVNAFAEEGKAPQIPGPLIRVRSGGRVRVTVRNDRALPLWVRGLQDHNTGALDSTDIAPGASRTFEFRAITPGAWYYWAGRVNAFVPGSGENGQLVGALVVDPPEQSASTRHDRVFVMTRWTPGGTPGNRGFQLNAINGLSWPHTERLTYVEGDSVRWHVINASEELHMMHLHGFYFRVDTRGDAAHDSALARTQRNTVVTTAVRRGEWMTVSWLPDRPGNWLFHCHLVTHMSDMQRLSRLTSAAVAAVDDAPRHPAASAHASHAMAGLVLGITVRPTRSAPVRQSTVRMQSPRDRLVHLFANMRPRVFGQAPGFGFIVQEDDRLPAADSIRMPGTPLVLMRGDPVRIMVHNRMPTPIAVHWHGMELESYYDGVAGWSGASARIAPIIPPRDSFAVRFTPPRAGTFMYHIHNESGDELASGLYAPLLVLERGQAFDPRTERIFVIATGGPGDDAPMFINGTTAPDTVLMDAGTTYRLRVIDIASNEAHALTLRGPSGIAAWRALARDGRDLPSEQTAAQPATENTAAGVTRDFEFTPATPGDYALAVTQIVGGRPSGPATIVPIRVRAP